VKRFRESRVGDELRSACSISGRELESYLDFAGVRNAFLENASRGEQRLVSGRAIVSGMEGEFTRLSQIYGNGMVLIGSDGDPGRGNRSTGLLRPLYTDDVLGLKFTISGREDIDGDYGRLYVDCEGTGRDGGAVLISRRNICRIRKEPPGTRPEPQASRGSSLRRRQAGPRTPGSAGTAP